MLYFRSCFTPPQSIGPPSVELSTSASLKTEGLSSHLLFLKNKRYYGLSMTWHHRVLPKSWSVPWWHSDDASGTQEVTSACQDMADILRFPFFLLAGQLRRGSTYSASRQMAALKNAPWTILLCTFCEVLKVWSLANHLGRTVAHCRIPPPPKTSMNH